MVHPHCFVKELTRIVKSWKCCCRLSIGADELSLEISCRGDLTKPAKECIEMRHAPIPHHIEICRAIFMKLGGFHCRKPPSFRHQKRVALLQTGKPIHGHWVHGGFFLLGQGSSFWKSSDVCTLKIEVEHVIEQSPIAAVLKLVEHPNKVISILLIVIANVKHRKASFVESGRDDPIFICRNKQPQVIIDLK